MVNIKIARKLHSKNRCWKLLISWEECTDPMLLNSKMLILGLFLVATFSKNLMMCGGLTMAGCQAPTKAALSLPSAAGQGTENIMKFMS